MSHTAARTLQRSPPELIELARMLARAQADADHARATRGKDMPDAFVQFD